MQQALAELNARQESINARRQMLYYRMETGLAPGRDADGEDNFAKPTVSILACRTHLNYIDGKNSFTSCAHGFPAGE